MRAYTALHHVFGGRVYCIHKQSNIVHDIIYVHTKICVCVVRVFKCVVWDWLYLYISLSVTILLYVSDVYTVCVCDLIDVR